MTLLLSTLEKRDVKLMILPRCIFPLASETTIHIIARPTKNIICDGRYDFRLAGLVQIIKRNDIDNITISAINVITLNLRFSILLYPTHNTPLRSKYKISNVVQIGLNLHELGCNHIIKSEPETQTHIQSTFPPKIILRTPLLISPYIAVNE